MTVVSLSAEKLERVKQNIVLKKKTIIIFW